MAPANKRHVSIVAPLHAIEAFLLMENIGPYEGTNTPITFGSVPIGTFRAYVQDSLMGTRGDFKQRWGRKLPL